MERHIVHLRIPGLALSVEAVRDPSLCGRPVVIVVGGRAGPLVQEANREAGASGIVRGMAVEAAKARCRGLEVIPSNPPLYRKASRAVSEILSRYSPVVEQGRAGSAFVDLSGCGRLFGTGKDGAWAMQKEIRLRLRLRGNVGLATNKLVSRVASTVIPPVGLCDIFPGSEASFLAPLDVKVLPSLEEPHLRKALGELNLRRVAHVAALEGGMAEALFGTAGARLRLEALGIDLSPVSPLSAAPAIVEEEGLVEETNDDGEVLGHLLRMVERASARLRRVGMVASRACLHVLYGDGIEASGGLPVRPPANLYRPLRNVVRTLRERTVRRRKGIRHLSLSFVKLVPESGQLLLFRDPAADREVALSRTLDRIRSRFGEGAISRGGRKGFSASR